MTLVVLNCACDGASREKYRILGQAAPLKRTASTQETWRRTNVFDEVARQADTHSAPPRGLEHLAHFELVSTLLK